MGLDPQTQGHAPNQEARGRVQRIFARGLNLESAVILEMKKKGQLN
jgi:hypothetical protein